MSDRRCDRSSCRAQTGDDLEPYCSDDCRRIHTAIARLPLMQSGAAVMGHGAAVVHALPWMDARAE